METQLLSRLLLLCTRSPSWLPFSLSSHSIVLPPSLILSCVSFSHVPVLHSGSPSLFICLSLVFSRSLILPCTRSPSRPPASLLSSLSLSSLSPSQSVSHSFMYSFSIQAPCLYLFICFSFFPRLSVFVLLYPLICHPPPSLISFLFFFPCICSLSMLSHVFPSSSVCLYLSLLYPDTPFLSSFIFSFSSPDPLPQSVFPLYMHLFSILPPFIPQSVSLSSMYPSLYTRPPSLFLSLSLFFPCTRSPSCLLHVPSVSRSPSLTHSSECDRQVLVTVEASSRARLLFGSAVPDLQPACPTFK